MATFPILPERVRPPQIGGRTISFTRPAAAPPQMTLDALMARQKELADQQAALGQSNGGGGTIAGGVGHMLDRFTTSMREVQTERQEAEARQRLAQITAGIDWDQGPTSQQIAEASLISPEQAQFMTQQMIEAARARREREQTLADRDATRAYEAGEWKRRFDIENQDQIADEQRAQTTKIADEGRATTSKIEEEQRATAAGQSTIITGEEAQKRGHTGAQPGRSYEVSADGTTIKDVTPAAGPAYRPMTAEDYKTWAIPVDPATGQPSAAYRFNITENKPEAIGGGGITIQNKGEQTWDVKNAENTSKIFNDQMAEGQAARVKLAQVDALGALLPQFESGSPALLTDYLQKNWGINLPGADKVSAFSAIVNNLVPTQRLPGSGTMSDRDVELFKASLPQLSATREGNQMILRYMRGLADYNVKLGELAVRAMSMQNPNAAREFYLSEATKLPNPLADFRSGDTGGGAGISDMSDEELDALIRQQGG